MERNRFLILKPGIRRSVVMHYFIVVFLTMLILEIAFMLAVRTYYYDSISNHLKSHAEATTSYFTRYDSILYASNESEWLPELLKQFQIPNVEVQILDRGGNVLISSTGFQVKEPIKTSDVLLAANESKITRWIGIQPLTDETVMAVSAPLIAQGNVQYVLRLVTSLENVNKVLNSIVLFSIAVSGVVLFIVFIISLGLANSIVRPINEITDASAQMARGRFDIRVKEGYKYELGELASTLNYLAHEIVRSNQLKNDFISSISHELRTPLTGIKGWSETLLSGDMEDPEETKMGLQIITKETDRLIGLVEELLDFSKLQQNRLQLHWEHLSMEQLIEESLFQVRSKAEAKDISLLFKTFGESGETPQYGDANRLKQVLLNLLDNAIKFSPLHSTIEVRMVREEKRCVIRVKDQGIGISEDHLTKVMDKFYQINPERGGTGLGLAISNEIVKSHGGEMTIESETGQGTTVILTLPCQEEPPKMIIED
ncbi:sensor histidine kinase [Paenibacillus marinisediminis]